VGAKMTVVVEVAVAVDVGEDVVVGVWCLFK
jgi:hypothetical protein